MLKFICLIAIFLSGVSAFGQSKILLTEKELFSLVEKNNKIVQAQKTQAKAFEAREGVLRRSFLPKASVFAGEESFRYVTDTFQSQPYYGARVEVNLFNGGRDGAKDSLNKTSAEQGRAIQKVSLFEQVEAARKSFWRIVYMRTFIQELESMKKVVKKSRQSALKRIQGSVSAKSDRFEFEIKDFEIGQDLQRMNFAMKKEMVHLKTLLGLEEEQEVGIQQSLTHNHNWRENIRHSESDHDYLLEPQKLEMNKFKIKERLAERKWLPKFDAYASWVQNNQRIDFDRLDPQERQLTVFGVKATWNITDFIGGRVDSRSQLKMAQSSQYKLEFQERELKNELHFELVELEMLDKMIHEAQSNIDKTVKFLNLIRKEYKRGVKNSGDMLTAIERLSESKIRKMQMIRDFHFAKAHIMTKLGR